MKTKSKIDIYHYTNYRKFLHDYYKHAKSKDTRISYEYIRRKIGYKSRSFYYQVVTGKTNISLEMAYKFAKRFLKLNTKQTEYFQLLVLYNQAKSLESKTSYSQQLATFKFPVKTKKLFEDHYKLLSNWYYLAMRELLTISKFKGQTDREYAELGKKLTPSIKPHQVKAAINLLKKLRLIKRNPQGFYKRVNQNIEFPPELDPHLSLNLMVKTMDLSKEAILRGPKNSRSFEAVTLSITFRGVERIIQEIGELINRITSISNDPSEAADRVYQFNCQFFPLTNIKD